MKQCILYSIILSLLMVSFVMPVINGLASVQASENPVQLIHVEDNSQNSLPCHDKSEIQYAAAQSTTLSMQTSHDCCADTVSFQMNQYCEHDDCNSNASSHFALLTYYLKSDFVISGSFQNNSQHIPTSPYEPAIIPPIA